MNRKEITMNFSNEFLGELIAEKGRTKVGLEENTLEPYDMLLGALGSCYYSTFLDVANKKRIDFDFAEIFIEGEKRDKPPATLKWVKLRLTIKNSSNDLGLKKAAALAAKYCSIYVTISKVADISWEINFL